MSANRPPPDIAPECKAGHKDKEHGRERIRQIVNPKMIDSALIQVTS